MLYHHVMTNEYMPVDWKESSALRIILSLFSFLHFSLIFHSLSQQVLIVFLVTISAGTILAWVYDLGLQTEIAKNISKSDLNLSRVQVTMRFYLLCSGVLVVILVGTVLGRAEIFLLLVACILDSHTDTSINIRQLGMNRKEFSIVSLSKRFLQIILLIIELLIGMTVDTSVLTFNLLVTSFMVLVIDLYFLGFKFQKISYRNYFAGISNLLQSAGTNLTHLDLPIISYLGGGVYIPVIAASRKYLGILSSISSAYQLEIFQKAIKSRGEINSLIHIFRRIACFVSGVMPLVAFCLIVLFPLLNSDIEVNFLNQLIILTMSLIAPWGIVNSLQNSVLLTYAIGFKLAFSTFVSSFLYLLLLVGSGMMEIYALGFCLAYILNWSVEYYLQSKLLLGRFNE